MRIFLLFYLYKYFIFPIKNYIRFNLKFKFETKMQQEMGIHSENRPLKEMEQKLSNIQS